MPSETELARTVYKVTAMASELMTLRRVAEVCPQCKGVGTELSRGFAGGSVESRACVTCNGKGARVIVEPFVAPMGEDER